MDVRRRSPLHALVCLALPALALALSAVLGLGGGLAQAASGDHSHTAAAVTPIRHHLPSAFLRLHDPISVDAVAADQPGHTSRTADHATRPVSVLQASAPNGTWHNRGPPAGEHT